jgi:hypothetical protein
MLPWSFTVGYPEVLAYALRLRDLLELGNGPPSVISANDQDGNPSALAGEWSDWWDRLMEVLSDRRGLLELNRLDDANLGLDRFPGLASVEETVHAASREWARAWRAGVENEQPAPTLVEGGLGRKAVRRTLEKRLTGRLANDLPVAVVPCASEWGAITHYGSLLLSDTLIRDPSAVRDWLQRKR